jgi:hypothetical protein
MFSCLICNKDFKRNQDLKTHKTKIHPTNDSVIVQESEPEIVEFNQQMSSVNQQTQPDSEADINLSFNLSADSIDLEQQSP